MVAQARILLQIEMLKDLFFCIIQGSYVTNFLKIGPQITSQSCPQMADGQTDGRLRRFIFCPMLCIALDRQQTGQYKCITRYSGIPTDNFFCCILDRTCSKTMQILF